MAKQNEVRDRARSLISIVAYTLADENKHTARMEGHIKVHIEALEVLEETLFTLGEGDTKKAREHFDSLVKLVK